MSNIRLPIRLPVSDHFAVGYITREALEYYVNEGLRPGNFLYAVLCNDLREAVAYADPYNYRNIGDIVNYIYHHLPSECWGSPKKVQAWLNKE